jgi:hypothetical protein
MRKLTWAMAVVSCVMLVATPVSADALDDYIELLRSDLQADKKLLVDYAMELSDDDAELFWPIYDAYEKERVALGDRTLDLIKRYPEAVNVTGPDTVRTLSADWLKLRKDKLALVEKYYKKAEKKLRPRIAARWMQVEHRIALLIDVQLASATPLIEPLPR